MQLSAEVRIVLSSSFLNSVVSKSMARGGKRPGAGRPKGNPNETYRKVSLSLSPAMLNLIDGYASEHKLSRSAAAEKLLRLGLQWGS